MTTRNAVVLARTRAGLLSGAAARIAAVGVRATTMSAVAAEAGTAKATVYNHFRTKDDVLVALVLSRADDVVGAALAAATGGLGPALVAAVDALAADDARARVAAHEPGLLAPLLTPADTPAWAGVRAGVAGVLRASGHDDGAEPVEVVLRHVLGHLLAPGTGREATLLLASLLPAALPPVPEAPPAAADPVAEPAAVG